MTEPTAITTIRKPPREALRDLEQVVVQGNLATLSENERIGYYARVCESLGLNPLTRPFEYITLNGKLTLYARKDATDQLRDIHGVSIHNLERVHDHDNGMYVVIAHATDRKGREDSGMGVVAVAGLKGEALANAMMKAETKAKRRATLSICGLGWMDEVEAFDARAIEVAPRAALAEGIASRRAAIEAASSETPTGGVSTGEGTPSPSPAPCDHSKGAHIATDEGVKCSLCGDLLAVGRAKAPRARRTAPAAKKPGDEGYGTARAHAVAAERGLDHDAVHRIAADVISGSSTTPVLAQLDTFSVANLDEDTWNEVIAAISEAPVDDAEAEQFAGKMALEAGMGQGDDAGNPWPELEPIAVEMFGMAGPDDLTPAQWREVGIRVYARNPLP